MAHEGPEASKQGTRVLQRRASFAQLYVTRFIMPQIVLLLIKARTTRIDFSDIL